MFKFYISLILMMATAAIASDDDQELRTIPSTSSVIIIGAGVSGIAAASRLVQKGYNLSQITILEAQNRIGGRINTVQHDSNVIELGAQWVEGTNGNVVYSLASANLTTVGADMSSGYADNVDTAYTNGDQVPDDQIAQFDSVIDSIYALADKVSGPTNQSLGDFFVNQYENALLKGSLNKLTNQTAWDMLDLAHRQDNLEEGSDSWFDLSIQGRFQFEESPGADNVWTAKTGYATLLDLLMKNTNGQPIALSDRIRLNSPVSSIQWDSGIDKVKVVSGNETFQSDLVLVTTSLGYLKANADKLFVPLLPQRKRTAISAMGFGTVDKIYLVFSKPFWAGANWGGISLLTKSANASSDWTTRILGFYTVRNQPNLLQGWITGAPARATEALTDAEVLEKCTALLQGAIAGTDFTFTSPIGLIRSQWATNPYFLGSYSYPSVQSNALGVTQADLATPVKDSRGVTRLLFAGEATNSNHYQTVHGAVESGWREADRIVQLVG